MKHYLLMLIFTLSALGASAQTYKLTGTIIDTDTKDAMEQVTVQLLKTDSSYVAGALSDYKGTFSITAPKAGRYLLKLSSVGYKPLIRNINIQSSPTALGQLKMSTDAVMLKGATVTGQAKKVVVKNDTFEYNSAAYRTPEGSAIEELVKRLPGAEVSDEGKITINGKEVKKIKIDGKEFMTGDTKTALKNLPTNIVERIKAYDEKSDLARVTGIDDGEEQTVLDFGIKKGMNKGLFANADASIGTQNRYSEKLMAAVMQDKLRAMTFGNANNVGDRGFGGGRGRFGGNNGLNATKMWGANLNYSGDKLQVDGSVRWNHSDGDVYSKRSSESFVSKVGAYSNSISQNFSRSNSWNAQMRLEWKPDTLTNIMFRPSLTVSSSDSKGTSASASYNDDPYLYVNDPLNATDISQLAAQGLMVNSSTSQSLSYSDNTTARAMLQVNRRLNSMGRNFTVRGDVSYNESDSKSLSTSNVHLYQVKDKLGNDSTYQTNRFNVTPTKKWSYTAQATYSEPLWKATFMQFSYKYNYSYSRSDRATYDFSNLGEDFFTGAQHSYRQWDSYLNLLPKPYTEYEDKKLSRYSEYKNTTHNIEMMFRMIRNKFNFNAGVMLQPQRSHFIQDYHGVHADTTRTVTNFTPTLDFRYRFSPVHQLRINYRGTTSQPSMSQMLDITDDSNPLSITKGNPGLKPAFTNNLWANYNNFIQKRSQAINAFLSFSSTRNAVGNMVTYNEKTGGTITQPVNINGTWNIRGGLMYNTSIDTTGVWNVNTSTNVSYNNMPQYVMIDKTVGSQKNLTKSMNLSERLELSFRTNWLELAVDGSVNYMHSRNELQSQSNLDTWQFSYGGSAIINTPWGTSLSTDLHQNSRRGYNEKSMNTNELVWNAQISQSFLRGKPLTVMLQFYDILDNLSNFSRTVNAMQRSDTQYNNINSYAMLHVVYRFNMFGGKMGGKGMGPGNRGDRPGEPRRSMGMPPGGFGGRPPHGGGRPPMM